MGALSILDLRKEGDSASSLRTRLLSANDDVYEIIWPLTEAEIAEVTDYLNDISEGKEFPHIQKVELVGRGVTGKKFAEEG